MEFEKSCTWGFNIWNSTLKVHVQFISKSKWISIMRVLKKYRFVCLGFEKSCTWDFNVWNRPLKYPVVLSSKFIWKFVSHENKNFLMCSVWFSENSFVEIQCMFSYIEPQYTTFLKIHIGIFFTRCQNNSDVSDVSKLILSRDSMYENIHWISTYDIFESPHTWIYFTSIKKSQTCWSEF